jgi:glycosyltransferase involved in cell wall biosynthesis
MDEPQFARRLGENARRRMADEFSLSRMIDRHAAMYRELAGENRESAATG